MITEDQKRALERNSTKLPQTIILPEPKEHERSDATTYVRDKEEVSYSWHLK
jgi:hypothetical protein